MIPRVEASGQDVGQRLYWRFYSIENVLRVLAHSILTAQMNANYWTVVVDPKIQGKVTWVQADYAKTPQHTTPGPHAIYYVFLPDLIEIIRTTSHLFRPLVPDIDQWIVRIERIRLSRNVVGHMNWLRRKDRRRVARLHVALQRLVGQLAGGQRLAFRIP